jgi:hypothetical protein
MNRDLCTSTVSNDSEQILVAPRLPFAELPGDDCLIGAVTLFGLILSASLFGLTLLGDRREPPSCGIRVSSSPPIPEACIRRGKAISRGEKTGMLWQIYHRQAIADPAGQQRPDFVSQTPFPR